MIDKRRTSIFSIFAAGLLLLPPPGFGAEASSDCVAETGAACEAGRPASFGGPEQVENRLHIDSNQITPMFPSSFARGYFDWKDQIKEEHKVGFGGDYSFAYLNATESPGEDDAFGGMYRFFGSWEAVSGEGGNSGALIWKVEHRHAYGSNVAPGSLGFETGYVGIHLPPFSDQETRLTNLYWRQRMNSGNLVFVGGFVDVTDYLDVYMLASPWTGYFNFAFSTGSATMAVPNEGWGMALGGYLNDNWYLIGGFADSNSDPTDPLEGLETFFDDREYFKHIELGWNATRQTAFLNNIHLTLWHNDEREAAATPDGWGANLSFSKSIDERWIPFLRLGFAEDAGTLLERSVSTGFAYQAVPGGNQLGFAYNYGVPNEDTWGPDLDDQHTIEAFYRIQLWKEVAITPDIQYIRNPALNPDESSMWVFGLRTRLAF
jgi:porin